MKPFEIILVLAFLFALAGICYAQKNTVALMDTKSFYSSETGITRLIDALKSANPNFLALTAEEKDKEFKRLAKECPISKEDAVCIVIKDITESLENFKKKQEFAILADISSCDYVTHLCETAVDVTTQFIEEYNGARK